MDETYWRAVIENMRAGISHALAHDMAFDEMRLGEHFAVLERRRRNAAV